MSCTSRRVTLRFSFKYAANKVAGSCRGRALTQHGDVVGDGREAVGDPGEEDDVGQQHGQRVAHLLPGLDGQREHVAHQQRRQHDGHYLHDTDVSTMGIICMTQTSTRWPLSA